MNELNEQSLGESFSWRGDVFFSSISFPNFSLVGEKFGMEMLETRRVLERILDRRRWRGDAGVRSLER